MSVLHEFAIPIVPTPKMRQQSCVRRGGHAATYTPARQKANAETIIALLAKHAPKTPATGSLRLDILCCLPIPKSMTKRDREKITNFSFFPAKKPDLDNLDKQIMDAMTRLRFWEDDSQVCLILSGKMYSETPCWLVRVMTCQPDSLWRMLCSSWNISAPDFVSHFPPNLSDNDACLSNMSSNPCDECKRPCGPYCEYYANRESVA